MFDQSVHLCVSLLFYCLVCRSLLTSSVFVILYIIACIEILNILKRDSFESTEDLLFSITKLTSWIHRKMHS